MTRTRIQALEEELAKANLRMVALERELAVRPDIEEILATVTERVTERLADRKEVALEMETVELYKALQEELGPAFKVPAIERALRKAREKKHGKMLKRGKEGHIGEKNGSAGNIQAEARKA